MGAKLKRLELLKDLVQQGVERGATSIEQIHSYIASLPFEALDKAGLLDERARGLQERHNRTVGMVYDAIRRINSEIGQLISDQIENLEDGDVASQVLRGNLERESAAAVDPAPAKAPARPRKKKAAAPRKPRARKVDP